MSKNDWKMWVSVAGRLLLGYALILSQCVWAGQNSKTTDKANSPQQTSPRAGGKESSAATTAKAQGQEAKGEISETAVAEEKPSRGASHEDIKVHGHWTIEVRNPDGTVVTQREFENALSTPQYALYAFLSRTVTVGTWTILLGGGPAGNICSNSGTAGCFIGEPNAYLPVPGSFLNLVISGSVNNFVLSGTAVANLTGSVGYVFTEVASCPPSTATSLCAGTGANYTFTTKQVTPEIPVSTGQTVAVTVTISFS